MIVDLIRTMDRVMLKGRSRAVRTDPYTRLLLVYLSLTLPLSTGMILIGSDPGPGSDQDHLGPFICGVDQIRSDQITHI
jgi:hypothetical protein